MAGETSVGSIVGFLRLDADQFHREITTAIAELERLDGKNVSVDVRADTARAEAGLARTEVAAKRLDGQNANLDKSSRNAGRGMGALATAVITLGPAIVPIAAGATGLAVAFGGMGAAGVAALVGISREMKDNTATGAAFRSGLDQVKGSFDGLARSSAKNILGDFQNAVGDLQGKMPALSSAFDGLSSATGKTAGYLAGGLLSAFLALEPLMRDAAGYVVDLSARFSSAMSGPGVVAFGDYVRSVFPQVMAAIESIVVTAGHLVAAFAPLGLGTLSTLRVLSDLISAIPTDTLASLATAATSVYIGFSAWKGLSGLVGGLGTTLEKVGFSAESAAKGVRGLQAAAGIIGVALAGLSFIMTANAESNRQAEQSANDYADALRASNGVIDESIRKMTAKKLADAGVLEAGRLLGISLADITSAAIGEAPAIDRVNAALRSHAEIAGGLSPDLDKVQHGQNGIADAAKLVTGAISGSNTALQAGIQTNRDLADATTATGAAAVAASGQVQSLAQQNAGVVTSMASAATAALNSGAAAQIMGAQYGTTGAIFQQVTDAQNKTRDAAAQATVQMQLENNAAGLLKQSLDALSGKSLSAAQAQNSFDSALTNMGDHVTKTGSKVTFTTKSINDMSTASVALRGQLLGQVTAAQSTAEAYGNMSGSAEAGRTKLIALRTQIINNAVAHGVDRKAVTDYVDSFLKIPKSVPPTKLDVEKEQAQRKANQLKAAADAAVKVRPAVKLVTDTALGVAKALGLSKQIQATLKNRPPAKLSTEVRAGIRGANSLDSEIRTTMRTRAAAKLNTNASQGIGNAHALSAAAADATRNRSGTLTISVVSNVRAAIANVMAVVAGIGASVGRKAGGPVPGYAGGGKLSGPGTGTSDSIAAVVRQTGRPVALSTGEYISTAASTRRNEAALAAGNKGAALQVAGQQQSMTGMSIVGTLDTPFGPAQIRGIVQDTFDAQVLELSRGRR